MPSCQSWSGHLFDGLGTEHPWFTGFDPALNPSGCLPTEYGLFDAKIWQVAFRALFSVGIILSATVDLIWWAGITITVYPMIKTGLVNHLYNLTSTLALYVFSLSIHLGYGPKVDHYRFFSKVGEAGRKNFPPNALDQKRITPHCTAEKYFLGKADEVANEREQALQGIRQGKHLRQESYRWSFTNEAIALGVDPNTMDAHGKPLWFSLLSKDYSRWGNGVSNAFDALRFLPASLRIPIHLDQQDDDGFDILAYALTGIYFVSDQGKDLSYDVQQHSYCLCLKCLNDEVEIPPIPPLLRKGVFLREIRFDDYLSFAEEVRSTLTSFVAIPENFCQQLRALHDEYRNSDNPYIRLAATRILMKPAFHHDVQNLSTHDVMKNTIVPLFNNAQKLVKWKDGLLTLSNRKEQWERRKHAIEQTFKDHNQSAVLGGNNAVSPIITAYLLGEAPVNESAT